MTDKENSVPSVEDADIERLNGYLYREHTRDFLFTASEWEDDTKKDIKENFAQSLIEEETSSMEGEKGQGGLCPPVDVASIHSHFSGDQMTEEERLAAEEEERLKVPFRLFNKDSYRRLVDKEKARRLREENKEEEEGRLVDGEIVFDEAAESKLERDPKLADGMMLPEKMGRFPKELLGQPLEEIDPYIKEKSFVAIAKKFSKFTIFRFSATNSLFIFSPWNPFRKFCIQVISNQWFDLIILTAIIINCFMMIVKEPTNPDVKLTFDVLEYTFQAVYTLELIFKVTSRGFVFNKFTYLRDGWNWLDFTVVVIAYVTILLDQLKLGDVKLTGLRAFRVLRALKSISVVPGLRTIVNALLNSMKMLAEVMLLTLFCIAVFALLALQLYMGVLRQKCIKDLNTTFPVCNATHPGSNLTACFADQENFEKWWVQQDEHYLKDDDDVNVVCGTISQSQPCPIGYSCIMAGPNPNWGYTHFDNFPWAMLNTLQLVTLDFWEDTYNKIIDSNGPWNILYFLMVVLLGSFYLINLMLAVVAMAYEQEADVEAKLAAEEEAEEKAKAKRKENTAALFDPKKLKQQLLQKQKDAEGGSKPVGEGGDGVLPANNNHSNVNGMSNGGPGVATDGMKKPARPVTAGGEFVRTGGPGQGTGQSNIDHMQVMDVGEVERGSTPSPTKTQGSEVTASGVHADMQSNNTLNGSNVRSTDHVVNMAGEEEEEEDEDAFHDDLPDIMPKEQRYLIQKYATLWFNKIKPDKEKLIDRNCLCCAKSGLSTYHGWMKFQNMVYKLATHGFFELFITLCIICNTIIMATEIYDKCEQCRHCPDYLAPPPGGDDGNGPYTTLGSDLSNCTICDQDVCGNKDITQYTKNTGMRDSHIDAMEKSNVFFTVVFTMEAVIKLTALSKEYFSVGWNNFDLVIVLLSLPDLAIYFGKLGSVPGVSELTGIVKIFRLMRIVKLAQSWSTMKTLLSIIFQTMGALGNLTAILGLIVFIFAVLGNQLLGEPYAQYENASRTDLSDYGGELPRWHFNTFFHSLLMVFRILCGEWIEPLWDCMRVVNTPGCTVFFLGTLVLGNFMVLNLFLALLLNAFTADNIKESKSDEESKMVQSIKDLINFCRRRPARAVTPSSDKMLSSQESLRKSHTRLNDILTDNQSKRPAITINGSTQSIKKLIADTDPHLKDNRNGNIVNVAQDGQETVELMSVGNGHLKTSRSESIISILSNGTNTGNGVLKNKTVNMSPENLKQIGDAFTTSRDEYANFESSMDTASAPKMPPVIVAEDTSTEKKTTVFSPVPETITDKEAPKVSDASNIKDDKDEEEEEKLVREDGTVNLPNCCCVVCHSNPKMAQCCPPIWTTHREVWARVVAHPVFEGFILFLIAASSITLCFEDIYVHEHQVLVEVLAALNIVFAVLFFIEMILKWLAYGFKKYFTSFWTILDFIIVLVAIVDIVASYAGFDGLSAFKILRVLRALRPLRAVSRWQNMKIVVNALIFALPAIGNVAVVIFVFWLIFAIMGVQTFKGIFYECFWGDEEVPASRDWESIAWACSKEYLDSLNETFSLDNYNFTNFGDPNSNITQAWPSELGDCKNNTVLVDLTWAGLCERLGGDFSRPLVHFDNVPYAYLALFQVATFEGWMEVMEAAIDAPLSIGGQSFRESRKYWYFYFMAFIIFGAFFTLNLFIGVIIDNFNVLKKKYDGSYLAAFLTENQRHYYNTLKKLGNKKPQKTIRRPKNKFQAFFFDIAVDTRFEIAITLIIFLNMVVMMLDYLPNPETDHGVLIDGIYKPTDENKKKIDFHKRMNTGTEYVNLIFTIIFVLEAVIKIIGLRLHYFRRAWNVFDFVIVVLSVFDIYSFFDSRFGANPSLIMQRIFSGDIFISPTLLRVVRVFRIGRVLRLVKSAKGIRKLLFSLIISIPALFNIAILLFIFMFIFAVMCMTLFARVRHVFALTDTINFDTFPNSIVLLFRLSTSAGWNDILEPLQDPGSGCNNTHYIDSLGVPQSSAQGNCGNETLACIILILYLFLSFMIIINMYIAVILENFTQAHEQEEIGITEDDFDMFYVVWEKYDPLATQYIKLELLSDFLADLEDPLGVPKPNGMAVVAFCLPIVEGDRIHCLDVLMALVRRVLHTNEEDTPNMSQEHRDANEKLKSQIADKYRAAFPQRQKIKVLSTTMQRKKEDVAAKTLQRAWRKHRMKQNILRIKELAMDASMRDSISHRLSDAVGSIKSRIGSAVSRLSRRGSTRSEKSIDSQTLNLPPELQTNNRLSPNITPRQIRRNPR